MARVEFKNITKKYGQETVIENMNLEIKDGSFTVLVGPSGCGKSTTLRMIAGLEKHSSGEIWIGERCVNDIPPAKRDVAMVFQNYALYPTMNVKENIEFGLKNKKVPKKERKLLINEISEIVGLTGYLNRKPSTLSGGQRQRVALARAMVKKPQVFLMDEPLSNLDAKLRNQMRTELIQLHKKLGTTFIYVTHDQVEAMSMGDEIVVMNNGQIKQTADPVAIYDDPEDVFTAQFIGSPPMNVLELKSIPGLNFKGKKGIAFIGFRPEKAEMSLTKKEGSITFQGRVITRETLGFETIYQVQSSLGVVMIKHFSRPFVENEELFVNVCYSDLYFFAENGQRVRNIKRDEFLFEEKNLLKVAGGSF